MLRIGEAQEAAIQRGADIECILKEGTDAQRLRATAAMRALDALLREFSGDW